MNKKKQFNISYIVLLVILLIIGILFLLGSSNNNVKKQSGIRITTTIEPKQEKIDTSSLSIPKERFDYYYQTFSSLKKLQSEYEQTYAKYGEFGFEEAKALSETSDFPEYGSINRKLASLHKSIPKFDYKMPPGEQYLMFRLSAYSSSLIFLNPSKDSLEGIDFASGKKKIIEDALEEVKNFNKF